MFEPNLRRVLLHRDQSARDRSVPSAVMSIIFIGIVASALAQPRWFYLKGGRCSKEFLGVQEYFFIEHYTSTASLKDLGVEDCITSDILQVNRVIVVLSFSAIIVAMFQLFMDLIGVKVRWLKIIRRSALSIIIATILVVIVIGISYYASELIKTQQEKTKLIATTSVQIDFGISYYLLIGAGIVGIITAGINLLRRYSTHRIDGSEILLDDGETFSVALPHSQTWSNYRCPGLPDLPPPPPYTP